MENKNSRRTMMLAAAALSTSDPAISQSAGEVLTAGKVIVRGVVVLYRGPGQNPDPS